MDFFHTPEPIWNLFPRQLDLTKTLESIEDPKDHITVTFYKKIEITANNVTEFGTVQIRGKTPYFKRLIRNFNLGRSYNMIVTENFEQLQKSKGFDAKEKKMMSLSDMVYELQDRVATEIRKEYFEYAIGVISTVFNQAIADYKIDDLDMSRVCLPVLEVLTSSHGQMINRFGTTRNYILYFEDDTFQNLAAEGQEQALANHLVQFARSQGNELVVSYDMTAYELGAKPMTSMFLGEPIDVDLDIVSGGQSANYTVYIMHPESTGLFPLMQRIHDQGQIVACHYLQQYRLPHFFIFPTMRDFILRQRFLIRKTIEISEQSRSGKQPRGERPIEALFSFLPHLFGIPVIAYQLGYQGETPKMNTARELEKTSKALWELVKDKITQWHVAGVSEDSDGSNFQIAQYFVFRDHPIVAPMSSVVIPHPRKLEGDIPVSGPQDFISIRSKETQYIAKKRVYALSAAATRPMISAPIKTTLGRIWSILPYSSLNFPKSDAFVNSVVSSDTAYLASTLGERLAQLKSYTVLPGKIVLGKRMLMNNVTQRTNTFGGITHGMVKLSEVQRHIPKYFIGQTDFTDEDAVTVEGSITGRPGPRPPTKKSYSDFMTLPGMTPDIALAIMPVFDALSVMPMYHTFLTDADGERARLELVSIANVYLSTAYKNNSTTKLASMVMVATSIMHAENRDPSNMQWHFLGAQDEPMITILRSLEYRIDGEGLTAKTPNKVRNAYDTSTYYYGIVVSDIDMSTTSDTPTAFADKLQEGKDLMIKLVSLTSKAKMAVIKVQRPYAGVLESMIAAVPDGRRVEILRSGGSNFGSEVFLMHWEVRDPARVPAGYTDRLKHASKHTMMAYTQRDILGDSNIMNANMFSTIPTASFLLSNFPLPATIRITASDTDTFEAVAALACSSSPNFIHTPLTTNKGVVHEFSFTTSARDVLRNVIPYNMNVSVSKFARMDLLLRSSTFNRAPRSLEHPTPSPVGPYEYIQALHGPLQYKFLTKNSSIMYVFDIGSRNGETSGCAPMYVKFFAVDIFGEMPGQRVQYLYQDGTSDLLGWDPTLNVQANCEKIIAASGIALSVSGTLNPDSIAFIFSNVIVNFGFDDTRYKQFFAELFASPIHYYVKTQIRGDGTPQEFDARVYMAKTMASGSYFVGQNTLVNSVYGDVIVPHMPALTHNAVRWFPSISDNVFAATVAGVSPNGDATFFYDYAYATTAWICSSSPS
ncbi:hypothetical protein [Sclerotinia sclerotiorum reovirus 1]|nr:hypothetical protein [Sclerotinia sclerotiorum reovirus 1]